MCFPCESRALSFAGYFFPANTNDPRFRWWWWHLKCTLCGTLNARFSLACVDVEVEGQNLSRTFHLSNCVPRDRLGAHLRNCESTVSYHELLALISMDKSGREVGRCCSAGVDHNALHPTLFHFFVIDLRIMWIA